MGPALLAAAAVSSAGFLVAWGAGPGGGERPVSFGTSGGSGAVLEGVLAIPGSGSAAPAVVICHPNPMAGGSMDNPIIRDLQVAFRACRPWQRCGSTSAGWGGLQGRSGGVRAR